MNLKRKLFEKIRNTLNRLINFDIYVFIIIGTSGSTNFFFFLNFISVDSIYNFQSSIGIPENFSDLLQLPIVLAFECELLKFTKC